MDMNFVIIGGDAAGMSAASRAKRLDHNLNVTVFEKSMDVSYSACGMPYNIANPDREIDDLVVRRAEVFKEKQGIDLMTGHRVGQIDRHNRWVSGIKSDGKKFKFPYDKLLIATGALPIIPEIPGADLAGVMALKSLDDGRRIKAYLKEKSARSVVIVGMGYIGMEMCEAFRERDMGVSMISMDFLPGFHETIAGMVRRELESNGVMLHVRHQASQIVKAGEILNILFADHGLNADMVLMAIGVTPNSSMAADAGLALGPKKSIAVNRHLQTSDENIFAAGDCSDAFHVVTGQKTWIPLALRANRAGWAVADNVCGKPTEISPVAGTSVFKVFDLQVARTGLSAAEATQFGFEPAEVVIESRSRAHAHPGGSSIWVYMAGDKKSGRLLGVQMVGKEGVAHRINAPAVALHNRMTVDEFSRTDLAYAPPFGPVWDPMLTAANQLLKAL
jgi:CoA-dependent NAD(P)H sulfur oxidoreductase